MELIETYNSMLVKKREEYREKNPKTDSKYRASSSGLCARKIYYETILRLDPTEKINPKTRRIFRLGDLVHKDIQKAIEESK